MVRNDSTSNVDLYQSELPQPQKEIVKRLRAFIARRYPELTESWKWHVPIYSLEFLNGEVVHLDGGAHAGKW